MIRASTIAALAVLSASVLLASVPAADAQTYVYPAPAVRGHRVEYRALVWKERVFVRPVQAQNFVLKKQSQGYEIVQQIYGGANHVRIRMPVWRLYATTTSNAEAHRLARQLRNKGYEARVVF